MRNQEEHLPVVGVGPWMIVPMLLLTTIVVILCKMDIIPAYSVDALKIPFAVIGLLLFLFGMYLWLAANFKVKIDEHIERNELATTGVYAIVRNPIYSFFLIANTDLLLLENNLILLILPVLYWIYLTIFLKRTEEVWLENLYGQEYRDYCSRVNRLIPWFPKKRGGTEK